tara:strand:+ start:7135 stop:7857 length:723 start_codon:yes stop_codon:yes gene_type:complete
MVLSVLAGLAGLGYLGKEFVYNPIQKQHFPDTTLLKNEILSLDPNAQGGYDITDNLKYRYERSNLDDIVAERYGSADFLEQYIADEQKARRIRDANEKLEIRDLDPDYRDDRDFRRRERESQLQADLHNRAEITSARLFREAQLRHQQEQAAIAKSYRNEDLIRQNNLALANVESNNLKIKGDQALALAELQENKNRSAWEQGIYQQQLEYDEEDRRRKQRQFYALLGQSILSEGLNALF